MKISKHPAFFGVLSALASGFSMPGYAHTGNPGSGFIPTLLHPFTGLDHLLGVVAALVCIVVWRVVRLRSR